MAASVSSEQSKQGMDWMGGMGEGGGGVFEVHFSWASEVIGVP